MFRFLHSSDFNLKSIGIWGLIVMSSAVMGACSGDKGPPQVEFETTEGNFVITLEPEKAPKTVENFLAYVDQKFFENTIFHRIIPDFVVQGGGFEESMKQKPTNDPVVNESDKTSSNERGTVAMARTNDPHSATSQFFINLKDNSNLNSTERAPGYTVFGKVTSGMEIIDKMSKAGTHTYRGHRDVPKKPIKVIKVSRL